MIEAVVRVEWLLRARRDQFRPLFSCYFACVVLDCCVLYYGVLGDIFLPPSPRRSGELVALAVEFLWIQQWLLPLLLAPPFVGSAFAAEKANRVLPLLLITSLAGGEIILGKFIARAAPLVLLGLAHLPFWGLFAGLIGFDAGPACILAAASLLPILAASAVSLVLSVWCRKSADAVVGAYAVFGAFILGSWAVNEAVMSLGPGCAWLAALQKVLRPFCPNYLLEPLWEDRSDVLEVGLRGLIALAAWGSVVVSCLGLACWTLKGATIDQPVRRTRLPFRQPPVDDKPIAWKERYRECRLPLALFRNVPTWLALLTVFLGTACLVLWMFCPNGSAYAELVACVWAGDWHTLGSRLGAAMPSARPALALVLTIGMLVLAALTVGVRCATAVSGERENHTWELLLLSPLSTQEIVRDKVHGILHSTLPYVAVYALAALPLAWLAGSVELLIVLMGVLLATPALWVAGATGINQSARCNNSWQSILATVRLIIGGTFLTAIVSNFGLGFLALILLGLPILTDGFLRPLLFYLVFGLFWTLVWWQAGREYLTSAEKWIDDFERTRGLITPVTPVVGGDGPGERPGPGQPAEAS
jgi:ABC-type transport system involved in multi-copper enzyme maturation permease subunit